LLVTFSQSIERLAGVANNLSAHAANGPHSEGSTEAARSRDAVVGIRRRRIRSFERRGGRHLQVVLGGAAVGLQLE